MTTETRFTLVYFGASKFEVIDNRPTERKGHLLPGHARQHEVLSDMTLAEAEAYVGRLNAA